MKPHNLCGGIIGAICGLCCLTVSMLSCHTWITSITIGDALATSQLIPAPVLWMVLVVVTILGPKWTNSDNATQPFLNRKTERLYQTEMWRQKKKFFKGRKTRAIRHSILNAMNFNRLHWNQAAEAFHQSGLTKKPSIH